jgi:1-acyl-sn-glycerol-3-phosphate acyltransferase
MYYLRFFNIIILNVWFYTLSPIVLILFLIFSLPILLIVSLTGKRRTMFLLRKIISFYGKAVYLTTWPWIKIKLQNVPKKQGSPYIFVENHLSAFDPFIQAVLPFELVQCARNYALDFPILGRVAKLAGYIDVNRQTPEKILETSSIYLKQGTSLIFFPEGTRSTNGKTGPFHSTAFRVAIENKTPIVPVVLFGLENKPPKGSFLFRPGTITVKCLNVVTPETFNELTPFILKKQIRKLIKDKYENKYK